MDMDLSERARRRPPARGSPVAMRMQLACQKTPAACASASNLSASPSTRAVLRL